MESEKNNKNPNFSELLIPFLQDPKFLEILEKFKQKKDQNKENEEDSQRSKRIFLFLAGFLLISGFLFGVFYFALTLAMIKTALIIFSVPSSILITSALVLELDYRNRKKDISIYDFKDSSILNLKKYMNLFPQPIKNKIGSIMNSNFSKNVKTKLCLYYLIQYLSKHNFKKTPSQDFQDLFEKLEQNLEQIQLKVQPKQKQGQQIFFKINKSSKEKYQNQYPQGKNNNTSNSSQVNKKNENKRRIESKF